MADTKKQELDFLDWTKKVGERIKTVHYCMTDQRRIQESDFDVMRALHRVWWEGHCPLYTMVADFPDSSSTQADLFSDNGSTTDKSSDKSE